MIKRLLIFTVTFCSASALYGQCAASASGSTTAAAEINARMCATETFVAGVGGVTANTLVITDTSSPAKVIAATGTGAYGVALSTAIAGASVQVQRYGEALVVMDNAATAGHLLIPGTSTVTDGRDSGQTASSAISTGTRVLGVLLTSAAAGATATVELSPAHFGTQSSGGGMTGNGALITGTVSGNVAPSWTAVTRDTGGYTTGGFSSGLTIPSGQAGWYNVCFGTVKTSGSITSGHTSQYQILINGGAPSPPIVYQLGTGTGAASTPAVNTCGNIYLAAGAVVNGGVYNDDIGVGYNTSISAVWTGQ